MTVEDLFSQFEANPPSDMKPCLRLWEIFSTFFLQVSADKSLISLKELALSRDDTPVYTVALKSPVKAVLQGVLVKNLVLMPNMAGTYILL